MFKKGKHTKKSTNKKHINILLSVLLVICLGLVGTVLGKYLFTRDIDSFNINISLPYPEYTLDTGSSFNADIKALLESHSSATKIEFGSFNEVAKKGGLPLDWADTNAVAVDVDNAGKIKAFVSGDTIYVLAKGGGKIFANEDSSNMFRHVRSGAGDPYETGYIAQGRLTEINDLENVNTSRVTNMSGMFLFCTKLTELDVTNFDTSKVTDMSFMFRDCETLTTLDVSNFDTSQVTNMQEMFRYVNGLTTLDISNFNTANVTNMQGMFLSSGKLTTLTGLNNFNTSNVQNMSFMFQHCSGLTSLDLSGFDTSSVTTMERMFASYKGKTLDVSNFDTSSVTTLHYMFDACSNITTLDLSNWDTSAVEGNGMQGMFNLCENLAQIDGLTGFDTSKATTMREIFAHCAVTSLDLSSFDTSNVTDMVSMFYICEELTSIYVSDLWNTDKVSNSDFMFNKCYALVGGAGTKWSSSYIRKERAVIDGGTSNPGYLTFKPLTGDFTLKKGTEFNSAIKTIITNNSSVTKIQFGSWDEYGVKNLLVWANGTDVGVDANTVKAFAKDETIYVLSGGNMFANADSSSMFRHNYDTVTTYIPLGRLTAIDGLDAVNTSNVTSMNLMFGYGMGLTSLDVTSFDTGKVMDMQEMFRLCSGLKELNVTNFDTRNVTDTRHMFRDLNITTLDLSSFDTSKVTNMSNMFNGCKALKTIYVSNLWNTDKVTDSPTMFYACEDLVGGEGTTLASTGNSTDKTYARIDKAITGDEKGYLTDKNAPAVAQLTTGSAFNAAIRSMFSTSVTKLQFGTYNDIAASDSTLANAYNASTTFVDVNNVGLIRVFTSGDTVYVLSDGDRTIYANENCGEMFRGCSGTDGSGQYSIYSYLNEINGLGAVNTSKVTDMNRMFYFCNQLTELDLSGWDTSRVETLQYMFYSCQGLTKLNLSGWDTSSVSNMVGVFWRCTSLATLDGLSSWNTSQVTLMYEMFSRCTSLTAIDLSSFDTSSVENMNHMFYMCSSLTTLNLSNFNTSNVANMKNMFASCTSLQKIYVSDSWRVTNVSDSTNMFTSSTALVGSSGTAYNAAHVDKAYAHIDGGTDNPGYLSIYYTLNSGMSFQNDIKYAYNAVAAVSDTDIIKKIKKIYIGDYNTYASTVEKITIYGSSERYSGEPAGIDYDSNTTDNLLIFYDPATDYVYVLAKGAYISANDDCFMMFRFMENLTEIVGLENLDTSGVTDMNSMFLDCTSLTTLDLSGFNTASVTSMGAMFSGCSALTSLDLSSFNTANVTSMGGMFYNCSSLQTIYAHNWDTNDSGYMMFYNCTSLKGGSGTAYSYENDNDATYAHIDGGTSNPGYFTDPAQNANSAAVSLDSEDATEADGDNQNTDTAETEADSTVEAILPDAQAKEEIESEQDADNSETEE